MGVYYGLLGVFRSDVAHTGVVEEKYVFHAVNAKNLGGSFP